MKDWYTLMYEEDVVKLLSYVPTYREIEVYIKNGISSIESQKLDEGLCQSKVLKYNDDEGDYTNMVDELQQGKEDVVFGNNDLGNEDVVFRCLAVDVIDVLCVALLRGPNSHKRTIGTDAAYAMTWKALMRLMTKVYCLKNEIKKMETELWNLSIKGNDLTAYTQRFQELILLCTKMVPEEEDRVKKFIGGLLNNIQGNVIAAEPTKLQDAIRIANNLMDQKLKGYAARSAENKRRFDNNLKDNRVQEPPLKIHNVLRDYTVWNTNKKGYARILPLCKKCKLHHHGPCPVKCGNCKKVGHQARDYWTLTMMTCYGCGGIRHTKRLDISVVLIVGLVVNGN
ncbi:reverse transcriptase domain-containing protein, partial [Tanacetum coccineum]